MKQFLFGWFASKRARRLRKRVCVWNKVEWRGCFSFMRSCGLIRWIIFLGSSRGNSVTLFLFCLLLFSNSSSQILLLFLLLFWDGSSHMLPSSSSAELCRSLCRIYQPNLFFLSHLVALLTFNLSAAFILRKGMQHLQQAVWTDSDLSPAAFRQLLLPISYFLCKKQLFHLCVL